MQIFSTSDRAPNSAATSLPSPFWRGKFRCRQARQYNFKVLISFLVSSFGGAFWTLKQIFSLSSGRSHPVTPAPGEPRHGVAKRVVFAADPAGIAELVYALEDELPADLAGAGLVAAGHVGELHVVDHRHQCLEAAGDVTLGGLAVIDVELQPEAVAADRRDDSGTLLLGAQQITRRVARVERLDDELEAGG